MRHQPDDLTVEDGPRPAHPFDPNAELAVVADAAEGQREKLPDTYPQQSQDDEFSVVRRHIKPNGRLTRHHKGLVRMFAPLDPVHRPLARSGLVSRAPRATRRRTATRSNRDGPERPHDACHAHQRKQAELRSDFLELDLAFAPLIAGDSTPQDIRFCADVLRGLRPRGPRAMWLR